MNRQGLNDVGRYGLILVLLVATVAGCDGASDAEITAANPYAPGEVEIIIDSMGVPHIYGGTDADVFYGYGYQLASDRMFQLEMFRRQALGRSAEILGEGGVLRDQQARIFNWRDWGRLDAVWMAEHEPERYALIEAYVAGINARVAEVRAGDVPVPFGFDADGYDFLPEPWATDDVYIVQKMAAFALDLTVEFEIFMTFANQLFGPILEGVELFKPARASYGLPKADRPAPLQTARLDPPTFRVPSAPEIPLDGLLHLAQGLDTLRNLGSNNWAVDGRHTETGMPLLAGDPHMRFDYSGLVYAVHLNSADAGGRYDVAGFAFVGAPGIAMGHNRDVVWSPTSNFADVMDMWEVRITDEGAHIADEVIPVVEREERFVVRGTEDAAGEGTEMVLTVREVPGYGTVVPHEQVGSPIPIASAGRDALVGWTGFAQRPARYFLELNDVDSVDAFEAAVDRMGEMSYNFVGADASGIRYRVGLDVPKRADIAPGREPWRLMDGSDPKAWWSGELLDKALQPRSSGGERGFVATANTDPFGFTSNGGVDDDPFYWGTFYSPGWRLSRIESELTRMIAEGPVTLADMMALQNDTHSNLADDLLPVLDAAWAAAAEDAELAALVANEEVRAAYALLAAWDRKMVRDSTGAVVFNAYAHLLTETVLADDLPLLYDVVMSMHSIYLLKVAMLAVKGEFSSADHVLQGGVHRVMLEALVKTADFLAARFGAVTPATYRYGDIHSVDFDGAFGMGMPLRKVPMDGGESTVNVSSGRFYGPNGPADEWVSTWIPMDRLVSTFDQSGQPEVYVNFPMGNVADPESEHFDDLLEDWLDGRYRKLLFEREAIVADGRRTIRIHRTEAH